MLAKEKKEQIRAFRTELQTLDAIAKWNTERKDFFDRTHSWIRSNLPEHADDFAKVANPRHPAPPGHADDGTLLDDYRRRVDAALAAYEAAVYETLDERDRWKRLAAPLIAALLGAGAGYALKTCPECPDCATETASSTAAANPTRPATSDPTPQGRPDSAPPITTKDSGTEPQIDAPSAEAPSAPLERPPVLQR